MLDGFEVFDFNVGAASASITPNGLTFNKSVVFANLLHPIKIARDNVQRSVNQVIITKHAPHLAVVRHQRTLYKSSIAD